MFARSIMALGALLALAVPACGYTLHTLHAFCSEADCADGKLPNGGLIQDAAGNLFGTTAQGGVAGGGFGVAFELVADETRTAWTYKVLYTFCAGGSGCPDGDQPNALIVDGSGNLYGTTQSGGAHNGGNIFKLSPGAEGAPWTLTVLHDFCSPPDTGCSGGYHPFGALTYAGASAGAPYDGSSPLYGTTSSGGQFRGGIAYALTVNHHGVWSQTPLYRFCRLANCADGLNPVAGLALDAQGRLFGTTFNGGGRHGSGVVFKLTPKRDFLWKENVLLAFNRKDGSGPTSAPALDAEGGLLGTTYLGGGGTACPSRHGNPGAKLCGVLYKLRPVHNHYDESVLVRFCSAADCADGRNPLDGVLLGPEATLFGTTQAGGSGHNGGGLAGDLGGGVLYEISQSFQILYDFCSQADCADGSAPTTPVIDASGNLFGTTQGELNYNPGTVYELTP